MTFNITSANLRSAKLRLSVCVRCLLGVCPGVKPSVSVFALRDPVSYLWWENCFSVNISVSTWLAHKWLFATIQGKKLRGKFGCFNSATSVCWYVGDVGKCHVWCHLLTFIRETNMFCTQRCSIKWCGFEIPTSIFCQATDSSSASLWKMFSSTVSWAFDWILVSHWPALPAVSAELTFTPTSQATLTDFFFHWQKTQVAKPPCTLHFLKTNGCFQ